MRLIFAIGFVIANLAVSTATANCSNQTHITDVAYAVNSSYFGNKYSAQLDELMSQYQAESGYLLLEFKVTKQQASEDQRQYNKWLANRRVDRIRTYLNQASYSAPIISRILTASIEDDRTVSILWCDTQANDAELRLAHNVE